MTKRKTGESVAGNRKGTSLLHSGKRIRALQLYSLAALPLLIVFVFSYIPMGGIIIAFKDYKFGRGIFNSDWVGLKNFEYFFKSLDMFRIVRNTVGLNLLFIIVSLFVAVALALLLFELKSRTSTKIFQTALITPNFLSWVIVSYMAYAFLSPEHGLFNSILTSIGMKPISWYSESAYWPLILLICTVWKKMGMDSVIYYASLMGVDSSIIEAAKIDGASNWQIKKHIMIPSLLPVMTILTILNIGNIFRADFGLFYQVTRNCGELYVTTDVIDTYVFRTMRVVGDMGMSSAVGLLQSIVGCILVLITNKLSKLIDPDSGLI